MTHAKIGVSHGRWEKVGFTMGKMEKTKFCGIGKSSTRA